MIAELEERALRAWPAAEREEHAGWALLFDGGFSKRTNSVQTSSPRRPAGDAPSAFAARIAHCEARYAARGLPCTVKLTAASRPCGLDAALARRGYVRVDPTSVQVRALAADGGAPAPDPRGTPPDAGVHVDEGAVPAAWLDAAARLAGVDRGGLAAVVARIALPRAFASVRVVGGGIDAVGLAVRDGHHVGLFEVATAAHARRRGRARAVVEALLGWGGAQGARRAWLQVVVANRPAQELYRSLGFVEAYRYWYRVAP